MAVRSPNYVQGHKLDIHKNNNKPLMPPTFPHTPKADVALHKPQVKSRSIQNDKKSVAKQQSNLKALSQLNNVSDEQGEYMRSE